MRWKYLFTAACWMFLIRVFLFVYHRTSEVPELASASFLLPTNLSHYLNSSTLIDLDPFTFQLNVAPCSSPVLLILVHSAADHFSHRATIRATWGSSAERVVFLLGAVEHPDLQRRISAEHATHRDVVQGSFLDTYRNLTYKQVMGLKWTTTFCRDAHFVFKVDDDVFLDLPQLRTFLRQTYGERAPNNLLTCYVIRDPFAKRSHRSKWRVSFKEYPKFYYPSYCSGFVIGMSPVAAARMYVESFAVPYFWIDDVFVTGLLAQRVGLVHRDLKGVIDAHPATTAHYLASPDLTAPPMLGAADLDQDTIKNLWTKASAYYDDEKRTDP